MQQEKTGHRGRTGAPLYRIRGIAGRSADRLSSRAWLRHGLNTATPDGEITREGNRPRPHGLLRLA